MRIIAPLMAQRRFIAYRLEWRADRGKYDKLPIEPWTGKLINAHDPQYWLTGAEILATGQPVAIVLTGDMFCVDLDNVRNADGSWCQFALEVCAMFPGAAFELSVSGNGIHIIGFADVGPHRTSSADLPQMQVYTRGRFIALTDVEFAGDITTDHTAALERLLATYLREPLPEHSEQWTNAPYPGFRGGIADDARLIETLLASRGGPRAVFGGGAHFRDLWHCNVPVLVHNYPPENDTKLWNYSAADQALANHLSFATGFDCERTARLMMYSGLRREKWERQAYMRSTVLRAVRGRIRAPSNETQPTEDSSHGHCSVIPLGTAPVPPLAYDSAHAIPLDVMQIDAAVPVPPRPPGSYITLDEQPHLFSGWTYLRDRHALIDPDGMIRSPAEFDVIFGGYEFQMTIEGTKPTKSAWDCFAKSELYKFPQAEGLRFDPTAEPLGRVEHGGLIWINSYRAERIERRKGDPSIFLAHMHKLFPHGHDKQIMLAYMAFVAQCRGQKADWTPIIQGAEGNGKTYFSRVMEYSVGQRYTYWPLVENLGNNFNSFLYGKLLICVEDLFISRGRGSLWEVLKPMVTQERLDITFKGVDSAMLEMCFNFIMNANDHRALRMTSNNRRIVPFFCPQQYATDIVREGMDEEYFRRLFAPELFPVVYDYLMSYSIPDQLHPKQGARRGPKTSSTESAIRHGRGHLEQEILEAIESRKMGFRGGFVSGHYLDLLLAELGLTRKLARTEREKTMRDLGYRLHGDLPAGRCTQVLRDGSMPLIYIPENGHPSEGQGWCRGRVEQAYEDAQAAKP